MKDVYEMNLREILEKYGASDKLKYSILRIGIDINKDNINSLIRLYNNMIIYKDIKIGITNKKFIEMVNILEKVKKDYNIEYHKVITDKLTYSSNIDRVLVLYDFDRKLYNIIKDNTRYLENKIPYETSIDNLVELYYLFNTNQMSIHGIGEKRAAEWDKLMNNLESDYNIDWRNRGRYLSLLKTCPFEDKKCIKEVCSNKCETFRKHDIFKVRITRG